MTATAFAGTSTYVAPAPAADPAACGWFIGGSFGQLTDVGTDLDQVDLGSLDLELPGLVNLDSIEVDDLDFNMYTLHVGRGLTNVSGWEIAAFLEVGYLDGDVGVSGTYEEPITPTTSRIVSFGGDIDFDIIPVTANIMVEHTIYGPVSGYFTAGAGYAWTAVSGDSFDTETDGGFYAQASAGLVYNINESFELFGGARWLYLNGLEFGESEFALDDSFAWEIGARVNF